MSKNLTIGLWGRRLLEFFVIGRHRSVVYTEYINPIWRFDWYSTDIMMTSSQASEMGEKKNEKKWALGKKIKNPIFFKRKKWSYSKKKKGKNGHFKKKMSHNAPCTWFSKANFQTQKKKSHLPVVILKFFTTTPNLILNF